MFDELKEVFTKFLSNNAFYIAIALVGVIILVFVLLILKNKFSKK